MMSKWAAEYDKAKGVEVNYQSIGSGGGIQQMTAKTFDFGCTDGPMNDEQLKKAKETGGEVVHIPLVMGAVVPAYNLEEVKEPLVFSGPVLADIFLGKIKKWDDKAIQDLNPGVKLPAKDIGVVHRSDGSGTTYIWVDYLSKVSPEWKKKVGVGHVRGLAGRRRRQGQRRRVRTREGDPRRHRLHRTDLRPPEQHQVRHGARTRRGTPIKADLEVGHRGGRQLPDEHPRRPALLHHRRRRQGLLPHRGTTWAVVYVNQPADKGQAGRGLPALVHARRPAVLRGAALRQAAARAWSSGLDKKLDSVKVASEPPP